MGLDGTVQVITDSTCTLPPDVPDAIRQYPRVVRTSVQFGAETWLEGSFTLDEFYERVARSPEMPHTSQPSPDEYLQIFQDVAPRGPALAILLSAALSGTYATGVLMAKEVPDLDLYLLDSQFFSSALGYMVAEASEMALAGCPRAAIVEQVQWRRDHTSLFIAVDTLDFLRRSGRVNRLQAGLATMLELKPLLSAERGKLEVVGRVRSRQRSLERLLALAEARAKALAGPVWLATMHGRAPEVAQWLRDEMSRRLPVERSFISEAPASVALHGGPGVVGVMVTPARGGPWQGGSA